ncbi:hypothetical protein COO60DRAFT_1533741 [Scenedesmus sp. NREL 46B-D3]|nr:hypothetical protein COO60DRAFT_1533741 [Scenedesmus sp. NREL 46B-D3]
MLSPLVLALRLQWPTVLRCARHHHQRQAARWRGPCYRAWWHGVGASWGQQQQQLLLLLLFLGQCCHDWLELLLKQQCCRAAAASWAGHALLLPGRNLLLLACARGLHRPQVLHGWALIPTWLAGGLDPGGQRINLIKLQPSSSSCKC